MTMTWHTHLGPRTLTGAEAALYLQILKEIVDPFYYWRLTWKTLDALGMLQVIEADVEGEEDLLSIEMDSDDWIDWETNISSMNIR